MKFMAYMDYDKKAKIYLEAIYFTRPTTRHTNPDVVSRKVVIECKEEK